MVDNTDLIEKNLLDFKDPGDFYVCHVIQRAKDKKAFGTINPGDARDEGQRLIKTWYVDSLKYFQDKIAIMKEVADANKARLYFMPQVRNKLTVNRVLAKAIIDAIDEVGLRYDHLIRTAVCGCHASRQKQWIVDVDDEIFQERGFDRHACAQGYAEAVIADILSWRKSIKDMDQNYKPLLYETRNGWGIVTHPFDQRIFVSNQDFIKKDGMMLAYCNF